MSAAGREWLAERVLPGFLAAQRWCTGRDTPIDRVEIAAEAVLPEAEGRILLVDTWWTGGRQERFLVPVAVVRGAAARRALDERGAGVLARLDGDDDAALVDGTEAPRFLPFLLERLVGGGSLPAGGGEIRWAPFAAGGDVVELLENAGEARVLGSEQSNSSVVIGERLLAKVYRRLEAGPHPEIEILGRLAEVRFAATPRGRGAVVYHAGGGRAVAADSSLTVLVVVQDFVPDVCDVWSQLARAGEGARASLLGDAEAERLARRLGEVTAELHLALGASSADSRFRPEPQSESASASRAAALREEAQQTMALLRDARGRLDVEHRAEAERFLARAPTRLPRVIAACAPGSSGAAIRCHGDYHLGQVLARDWGDDDDRLWIVDFEGEPDRPLPERRRKSSAVLDVAGMARSFHYAACARGEHPAMAEAWTARMRGAFVGRYWNLARHGGFLPDTEDGLRRALAFYSLEKAFYELRYELEHRPSWAWIPLAGLRQLLA